MGSSKLFYPLGGGTIVLAECRRWPCLAGNPIPAARFPCLPHAGLPDAESLCRIPKYGDITSTAHDQGSITAALGEEPGVTKWDENGFPGADPCSLAVSS